MSGSVKKIFTVLIVMVACVVVGALVLNVLLPNVSSSLVDALETMVFNATGMKFDWNGNGNTGENGGRNFDNGMLDEASQAGTLGGRDNGVNGLDSGAGDAGGAG